MLLIVLINVLNLEQCNRDVVLELVTMLIECGEFGVRCSGKTRRGGAEFTDLGKICSVCDLDSCVLAVCGVECELCSRNQAKAAVGVLKNNAGEYVT